MTSNLRRTLVHGCQNSTRRHFNADAEKTPSLQVYLMVIEIEDFRGLESGDNLIFRVSNILSCPQRTMGDRGSLMVLIRWQSRGIGSGYYYC